MELSARYPDLTPLEFFLWKNVESIVNKAKPFDLADLRTQIKLAFRSVTTEMLSNVGKKFYSRLACLQKTFAASILNIFHININVFCFFILSSKNSIT